MRTIFPIIIFLSLSTLAQENSIFQERGLIHNKCYRENAKYECSQNCKDCTLHLFAGIKAQLSMQAVELEDFCKHKKSDTGLTTFKFRSIKDQNTAVVIGFMQVKKEISEIWTNNTALKVSPVECPKD